MELQLNVSELQSNVMENTGNKAKLIRAEVGDWADLCNKSSTDLILLAPGLLNVDCCKKNG
jgi:hypothetical protein